MDKSWLCVCVCVWSKGQTMATKSNRFFCWELCEDLQLWREEILLEKFANMHYISFSFLCLFFFFFTLQYCIGFAFLKYFLFFESEFHLSEFFLWKWSMCVHMCAVLSHVCLFVTAWTVASQSSLSVEFSRQEYWRGVPFPTPGDLPNPGIESVSPVSPSLAGRFFTTVPPGNP